MPRAPCHLSPAPWPRHRWGLLIALVFAAHVGLIFAFGDRHPIMPRPPGPAPELRLAIGSNELLALRDPTLFALPHPKGFAAAAWREISQTGFPPFRWTEPPRWLVLPVSNSATRCGISCRPTASPGLNSKPCRRRNGLCRQHGWKM